MYIEGDNLINYRVSIIDKDNPLIQIHKNPGQTRM